MKRIIRILLSIIIVGLLFTGGHIYYLTTIDANETYPQDNYLDNETNKTALIIVAHEDDEISCAGTISMLCRNGWAVREMCFFQGWKGKDETRKKNLLTSAEIQGLKGVDFFDFKMRTGFDTIKEPWMPIPYNDFEKNYKMDSIYKYIETFIRKYNPSVIFTLDNDIGAYGHPDHIVVSKSVLKYAELNKSQSDFSIKKIYQPVYPRSLEVNIMSEYDVYNAAKKTYQKDGEPSPNVQIDITAFGEQKMKAMRAYETEINALSLFWPYYLYYPSWIYFRIFDREFFRVIDLEK